MTRARVWTTCHACMHACMHHDLLLMMMNDDDVLSPYMHALARASYRALRRAIASAPAVDAHTAPIAHRARDVLRQRVRDIVRNEIARARVDERSSSFSHAELVARCAVATAFFRRAVVEGDSLAAAHARASVGYADGARRRERRGKPREPSKRERRIDEVRKIVARGCDEVPFGDERARVIGMSEGLPPPRA